MPQMRGVKRRNPSGGEAELRIEERLRLARIILKALSKKQLTWNELEKIVMSSGGTHSRFVETMKWLLDRNYIIKTGPPRSRAPYRLNTEKVRLNEDGSVIIKLS